MILYEHAWMKPWQEGYALPPDFAGRQTDPVCRQLTGHPLASGSVSLSCGGSLKSLQHL